MTSQMENELPMPSRGISPVLCRETGFATGERAGALPVPSPV
jgi:hypothetical protein